MKYDRVSLLSSEVSEAALSAGCFAVARYLQYVSLSVKRELVARRKCRHEAAGSKKAERYIAERFRPKRREETGR